MRSTIIEGVISIAVAIFLLYAVRCIALRQEFQNKSAQPKQKIITPLPIDADSLVTRLQTV